MPLELREATEADADLLHRWRNDPVVRSSSFAQDPIELDSHRRWLARKLADRERTRIWILTEDGAPAGQVRYDREDDVAQVSVSIDGAFRGRGLGVSILELSAPRACAELAVGEIRALVKLTNAASLSTFERAGFRRIEETTVGQDAAAVFVWRA